MRRHKEGQSNIADFIYAKCPDLPGGFMVLECQICKVSFPKILQEMMLRYELQLTRLYAQLKAGVHRSRACGLHTTTCICICNQPSNIDPPKLIQKHISCRQSSQKLCVGKKKATMLFL